MVQDPPQAWVADALVATHERNMQSLPSMAQKQAVGLQHSPPQRYVAEPAVVAQEVDAQSPLFHAFESPPPPYSAIPDSTDPSENDSEVQCLLDLQAAAGPYIDVDMEDVHPTVATVISQPRGPHEYQLVPVSHPVYVDRVVERVVPIYVPIPVEQRVPFPVYVPMPVHTSQYVLNQYLHMVAGNTPPRHRPDEPSEVEGFQRPRLEQQPRACLTWREDSQQPILLPWRQQPILLPWHEPPAKQAGTSSQLSQKRRARLKPYERTEAEEVLSQKLEVFRRENDWVERRKMWDEWSPQMRAHAIYRSTVSVRTRLKEWREEDEASSRRDQWHQMTDPRPAIKWPHPRRLDVPCPPKGQKCPATIG